MQKKTTAKKCTTQCALALHARRCLNGIRKHERSLPPFLCANPLLPCCSSSRWKRPCFTEHRKRMNYLGEISTTASETSRPFIFSVQFHATKCHDTPDWCSINIFNNYIFITIYSDRTSNKPFSTTTSLPRSTRIVPIIKYFQQLHLYYDLLAS